MFDMTAREREILEEHAARMEENGSFLDRVKTFFGFDGEAQDVAELWWSGDCMRADAGGPFYMIEAEEDGTYRAYYDENTMRSGITPLISGCELEEAVEAIEIDYSQRF